MNPEEFISGAELATGKTLISLAKESKVFNF
jgi:hypothetical protein